MKHFFTYLTLMLLGFTVHAQYIYNDYDANQNETFNGWPNMPVVIANPDQSGINTSANVAQWDRTDWAQYDNVWTDLSGKIDFTTGSTFSIKVWSPIACDVLFKLEDQANGGISTERLESITQTNQWVQLDFDFSGEASDTYDKIVFFIDFATFNANTFYFDDIEGPNYDNTPPPVPTLTLPVTFDDPDEDYALIDFGGNQSQIIVDPNDANNNIVESIKTETAELWAGTTVGGTLGFAEPVPFAQDSTLMSVVVWSPEADIPVRLKVEDANDAGISVETETNTEVAMAWDTLYFNFANPVPGTAPIDFTKDYNKASIFFNFGTTGADAGEQTYYWDYMDFKGAADPKPLMEADIQDNFEDDGWGTIDTWYFQDPDFNEMVTTSDPEDGSNTVADYNRSGNFAYTNAQFVMDHRMDLTERNKFELDVYFPSSNDYSGGLNPTAAVKLQNSLMGGNAWMTQTEVLITVADEDFDQWITLEFDFSAVADSVNYDQVVVQLGGEGHNAPGQFYFDNFYLKHVPFITVLAPNGGEEIEQNSSFTIEWEYGYWDGELDIELIKGSDDPEPLAIGLSASDSTYEWNVFYDQEAGNDYRIVITSQDDPAITDTSDMEFTIIEVDGVVANFSGEPTVLEEDGSVTFTDLSSGNPDSWEWYFEGGTPETYEGQTPPEIFYETAGTYDVSLTVYSGNDSDVTLKEDYIEVTPPAELMPPLNLQAVIGMDNDVQLSWDAPGTSELVYDNDVITGAYSYEGYTMATHMSPEGSCKVLGLKFYTTIQDGDNTFNANVYGWADAEPGTDLVYTESVTAFDEMWVHVDVSAQDINFTGDFVVGFGSINGTTFLGYDGDFDNGRSWDFDNDATWAQWNEAYLIRAIVQYSDGNIVEIGNTTSQVISRSSAGNSAHGTDYSKLEFNDPMSNQNKGLSNLLGYNVYRDGMQINEDTVFMLEYNDPDPTIGSHDYHVTALYESGESEPSNTASVVITSLNEMQADAFRVYPNPVTDVLYINNGNALKSVIIYSINGRLVHQSTGSDNAIDVSDFPPGIYTLQARDQDGSQYHSRFIVK
jgi:PKD repeat protein